MQLCRWIINWLQRAEKVVGAQDVLHTLLVQLSSFLSLVAWRQRLCALRCAFTHGLVDSGKITYTLLSLGVAGKPTIALHHAQSAAVSLRELSSTVCMIVPTCLQSL